MESSNNFTPVDYKQYDTTFNAALLNEWRKGKRELNKETLRALMYGYTFTESYAKGKIDDALSMDYWKEKWWGEDFYLEPEYECPHDYCVDTPQELLLMEVIESTGDGNSPETAFCVIDVGQEYEYIRRKFPFNLIELKQQYVSCEGIDCLQFQKNMFDIDCLYFNINRRFEVEYRIE